ncbi:hypothetical protein L9Z41_01905 [Leptospira noguchii]|uniref:Uncharacterized protein n=2 Tax=Leptospira noguchii TaxID=28182 RepID=T0FJD6_9LEPT|nr:hypothetical protein [Leptospira noguchii]EMO54485.1 hypothetical protein LEP1GSC172_2724 [Leptospira noguchii]EQA73518.1 hypothetical protein LEP1GSC059_0406 [Leptospira noguchii serovar Panama str. CZ214]MCH1911397.1 hypothetical protein [Leptospira noguchii]MCH1914440.1 hypothetical protein [Leptospira noguchii]
MELNPGSRKVWGDRFKEINQYALCNRRRKDEKRSVFGECLSLLQFQER